MSTYFSKVTNYCPHCNRGDVELICSRVYAGVSVGVSFQLKKDLENNEETVTSWCENLLNDKSIYRIMDNYGHDIAAQELVNLILSSYSYLIEYRHEGKETKVMK